MSPRPHQAGNRSNGRPQVFLPVAARVVLENMTYFINLQISLRGQTSCWNANKKRACVSCWMKIFKFKRMLKSSKSRQRHNAKLKGGVIP